MRGCICTATTWTRWWRTACIPTRRWRATSRAGPSCSAHRCASSRKASKARRSCASCCATVSFGAWTACAPRPRSCTRASTPNRCSHGATRRACARSEGRSSCPLPCRSSTSTISTCARMATSSSLRSRTSAGASRCREAARTRCGGRSLRGRASGRALRRARAALRRTREQRRGQRACGSAPRCGYTVSTTPLANMAAA